MRRAVRSVRSGLRDDDVSLRAEGVGGLIAVPPLNTRRGPLGVSPIVWSRLWVTGRALWSVVSPWTLPLRGGDVPTTLPLSIGVTRHPTAMPRRSLPSPSCGARAAARGWDGATAAGVGRATSISGLSGRRGRLSLLRLKLTGRGDLNEAANMIGAAYGVDDHRVAAEGVAHLLDSFAHISPAEGEGRHRAPLTFSSWADS